MNNDNSECPECFGKSGAVDTKTECQTCLYVDSCRYCANDDGRDKKSGHVSYDRYSYSTEAADVPNQYAAQCYDDSTDDSTDMTSTRQVLEFLLDIDNYTAELLHEVLHGNCNTTSQLAAKFGVSRQAIHRKIVDACTLYPNLRKLFMVRLYRCRRIMHDSDRLQKQRMSRYNPNQQELF